MRLIHGDINPAGPGYKDQPVAAAFEGWYDGREQAYHPGSFAIVPDAESLQPGDGLTLSCWVFPTTPGGRPQALLARWDAATQAGYALVLDENGALALWLGDGRKVRDSLDRSAAARLRLVTSWRRVSIAAGNVRLRQSVRRVAGLFIRGDSRQRRLSRSTPAANRVPFTIGAWTAGTW